MQRDGSEILLIRREFGMTDRSSFDGGLCGTSDVDAGIWNPADNLLPQQIVPAKQASVQNRLTDVFQVRSLRRGCR